MMKILYFGSACDQQTFNIMSKKNASPSKVAQYRFEMALLNGLFNIEDIQIEIFYLHLEPYYPKGKNIWYKSSSKKLNDKHKVKYISGINLPLFKELYNFLCGLFITFKWIMTNWNEPKKIILTPFQYTPLALGIFVSAKVLQIKRTNIFTDMSSDIMNKTRQRDMIWLKKIMLPYYKKLVYYLESSYDYYIFFTKEMNEIVNPANKPYLVMEGICNGDLNFTARKKERAIMYAGTLSFEYGVKMLLDAFEQINDSNLKLWLFGEGDMSEYILGLCARDARVTFFGFTPHEEVFEYEKSATLLINTRNPEDIYTRYSFPSKTFEYMLSGTPFLTTKIASIPDEYYEYIYCVDNYDIKSIKHAILEIFDKSQEELDDLGHRARMYILNEKNNINQTKDIVRFLRESL